MSNKKKVLIYEQTHWAIGRVYKGVEKYLTDEFVFTYYDLTNSFETIISVLSEFDIVITNVAYIENFTKQSPEMLKKFIFCCHGFPDLQNLQSFDFPLEPTYSVVSKSILQLFPESIQPSIVYTYNGVELSNFNYNKRSGVLEKIGWCGAPNLELKRAKWCTEISSKTNLLLTFATNLPIDKIKEWYNKIDLLLINSGPEYWKETGPLPAFEAIASGVLVIGTKVGNFAEIPGPKYETIEEAVAIIEELKQNPEKVKQLTLEQYECVKKNWTYEVLADQWRNMYKNV